MKLVVFEVVVYCSLVLLLVAKGTEGMLSSHCMHYINAQLHLYLYSSPRYLFSPIMSQFVLLALTKVGGGYFQNPTSFLAYLVPLHAKSSYQ